MTKTVPIVKIADRTLAIFENFARTQQPASLSELSEALEIPVSSCFGLVRTIEARGFLRAMRPRGAYYPTSRLLHVATRISENDLLSQRVEGTMAALRDETGETVVLGQRRGYEVAYICVEEARASIRYSTEVGDTRPLHANSIGKALLSLMSPRERAALLGGMSFPALTSATLTSAALLEEDLAASARRGWCQNIAESSPDVSAVACGLWIDGQPFGLSVVGPRERFLAALDGHVKAMLRAAEEIADTPI